MRRVDSLEKTPMLGKIEDRRRRGQQRMRWLDLNKFKQFSYLSSKWVVKWQRKFTTLTIHLAQELLTNVQFSGGLRSFAKETRTLKMSSVVASCRKLTVTIESYHRSRSVLLQPHEALPKNSASTILWSFGLWNKLERWKSSVSGCLMS